MSTVDDALHMTHGDRIFERMLEMIYSGELPLGAVVNESALANQFGVSRGPIREAVRRLQGIQLVTRGAYLKARVATLRLDAVIELFQMREALEGYACRLAAERMSDDEIVSLSSELERSRSARMANEQVDWDKVPDFHVRIVKASRNERIIESLCGDLYHLLRLYRRHSGDMADRRTVAFQEHWQILRALKARDPDLAESLMRSHIARATQQLTAGTKTEAQSATAISAA